MAQPDYPALSAAHRAGGRGAAGSVREFRRKLKGIAGLPVTRLPPPIRIRATGRRAAVLQLKPAKFSSPSSRQLRARPNRPNRVSSYVSSVSEDNRYLAKQLGRTTRIGRSNNQDRTRAIDRAARSQNGGLTVSPQSPHRVAVVGRLSGRRFSASRMPLLCRKILCARLRPRRRHYLAAAPMRPAPL